MGWANNLAAFVDTRVGINPTNSAAATTSGTGIEIHPQASDDQFLSAVVHLQCGSASGTPDSFTVDWNIQDSADNSSFTTVTTGTTMTAAAGTQELALNLEGYRRYLRVQAVVAFVNGTSPAIPIAATVVLMNSLIPS